MSLTAVGAPLTTYGSLALDEITVVVHGRNNELIRFDDYWALDTHGPNKHVTLGPEEAFATLFLQQNTTYAFEAVARDAGGHELAVGEARKTVVAGGNNAVALQLTSLIAAARLERRLPIHSLLPGQTVDLMLTVSPPGRLDLIVPTADFTADFVASTATVLAFSERGVRVRAGERTSTGVAVTATAHGQLLAAGDVSSGVLEAAVRLPFSTSVSIDVEAPEVETLAFDATQLIFTGVADDDLGVVRLDLYDGPVLFASSDLDVVAEKSIPEIQFPGGGTAFVTRLRLPPGNHTVTAYASDFSGNHGEASLDVLVR